MGTHMLLYPEREHVRRGAPSWGGGGIMHDTDRAGGSGAAGWRGGAIGSSYGSAGNTWSRRLAAGNDDSWEVRAFAEDASSSGQWPPRSYACSFCQREFRTAQALGGHMNVHRRERAHHLAQAQERLDADGSGSHSLVDVHSTTTSPSVDLEPYRHAQLRASESNSPSDAPLYFYRTSPYETGAWRFQPHEKHSPGAVDLELRLGRRHD